MLVEYLADFRNPYHSTDCANQQNICLLVIIKTSSVFSWNGMTIICIFFPSYLNVLKNLHAIGNGTTVSSLCINYSEVFTPNILSSFSSHHFLTFNKSQSWVVKLVSLVSFPNIHETNIDVFSFAYAHLCVCQEEVHSYSLHKSFVVKLMLHTTGSSIRKEHSTNNGAAHLG